MTLSSTPGACRAQTNARYHGRPTRPGPAEAHGGIGRPPTSAGRQQAVSPLMAQAGGEESPRAGHPAAGAGNADKDSPAPPSVAHPFDRSRGYPTTII